MAWESRGGKSYFYAAKRVGGRVVKSYGGPDLAGRIAELASRLERKAARDAHAATARQLAQLHLDAADAEALLKATAGVLVRWLEAAGFHRPRRGAWRLKRGFTGEPNMELMTRRPLTEWRPRRAAGRVNSAVPRPDPVTKQYDAGAVAAFLEAEPVAVAILGDLTRDVAERYADKFTSDKLMAAAIVAHADSIRRDLAGETPNAIEVLLAERAAVCWLALNRLEYSATSVAVENTRVAAAHDRRIGGAHKRFLSSLATLAAVRRVKLPDLLAVVAIAAPEPATAQVCEARTRPTTGKRD